MKSLLLRLQCESFVLDLRAPLSDLPPLDGYPVRLVDPTTLEVDISKEQSVNDLFCTLQDHGIEVLSMRNKVNRLEELFLRLVEGGRQ